MGPSGAVSSDHVLASAVGADVLKRGGNAVDAAIAMAGVLAVVRPHMNGVGGDNFLLIREAKTGWPSVGLAPMTTMTSADSTLSKFCVPALVPKVVRRP